jgi:hypothetical protein
MGNFKGPAVKSNGDLKIILKEVMGCIKIELDKLQFIDFSIDIARKIKIAQFKGVESVPFLIDDNL